MNSKTYQFAIFVSLFITIFACAPSAEEKNKGYSSEADSISTNNFVSSSAAIENNKDSTHRFVRTAEMKFSVKSVINSTYNIEEITNKMGGFVTFTHLKSEDNGTFITQISEDSSLKITNYTVTNDLIIRVPNLKLDTILRLIAKNIDFLDYRIIKAEDVALQLLANKLTQNRSVKQEKRLTKAIENNNKKLIETTTTEELILNKQEQADQAKISNLSINDQINYSTITLNIYQKPTTKKEIIANDIQIKPFEPSFLVQLWNSIKIGLDIFAIILVNILKLWPLILIGGLVYWFIKRTK
ncbi:MAG: DUF4349 domain-containing protein [Bacteroidia bacterium]